MRIFAPFILAILILITPADAHEISFQIIKTFTNQYNSFYEKSPQVFESLVGTANIKVVYTLPDNHTVAFGVNATNGKIVKYLPIPYKDSTITVTLSEETMNRISASSDPVSEFRSALSGGEIKLQGITLASKIKIFVANVLTTILSPQTTTPIKVEGSILNYILTNSSSSRDYPSILLGQYAASEDIGSCGFTQRGVRYEYITIPGMSVILKSGDGSWCKNFPVNLCLNLSPTFPSVSRPYFKIVDNVPRGQQYYLSINLPDGWGMAPDNRARAVGGEIMYVNNATPMIAGSYRFIAIKQGQPTPPRVYCDNQTTTSTTTSTAATTTSTSTTTTGATTTTSNPMPDLEVLESDIRDATVTVGKDAQGQNIHKYEFKIYVKNKGNIDSGPFYSKYSAQNYSDYYGGFFKQGLYFSEEKFIDNVKSGEERLVQQLSYIIYSPPPQPAKNLQVNVSIDFKNQVSESNENNNFVSKNVSVVTTPTTTTTSTTTTNLCGDAFVMAYNSTSGECRDFPVNCIPSGWTVGCSGPTTTSAGLPDLNVTSYVRTNSLPSGSSPYSQYLNFSIRNLGTADAGPFNINVSFENRTSTDAPLGSSIRATRRIDSLAAGQSLYFTYNITGATWINPYYQWYYRFNITADVQNEVTESNENNNFDSKFFGWNLTYNRYGQNSYLNFINSYNSYQG